MAVPKLRFKGFDEEWKYCKIGDLADIVRGASPRPIKDPKWFEKNSDVGWLRIADVTEQNGRIHHIEQHISKLGEEKTRVLRTPHLLLSIAATVGSPVINYVNTGVHDGFIIFNNPKFDKEYMFQWLLRFKNKWKKYGQPGSQVNLNSEIVSSQTVNIPSIDEQQKIGSFFKKIDRLINLQTKKIEHLKRLKRGYLQKMFVKQAQKEPEIRFNGFYDDWKEVKLGKDFEVIMGQSPSSINYTQDNNQPILVQGNADIRDGLVYPRVFTKEITRKSTKGNIILTVRAPVGETAINQYDNVVIGRGVCSIDGNEFLFYLLQMLYKNNVWSKLSVGSTFSSVSSKDIKNLMFKMPSLNEQRKIGSFFSKLDDSIETENKELQHLKLMKKGYLQQMFC